MGSRPDAPPRSSPDAAQCADTRQTPQAAPLSDPRWRKGTDPCVGLPRRSRRDNSRTSRTGHRGGKSRGDPLDPTRWQRATVRRDLPSVARVGTSALPEALAQGTAAASNRAKDSPPAAQDRSARGPLATYTRIGCTFSGLIPRSVIALAGTDFGRVPFAANDDSVAST